MLSAAVGGGGAGAAAVAESCSVTVLSSRDIGKLHVPYLQVIETGRSSVTGSSNLPFPTTGPRLIYTPLSGRQEKDHMKDLISEGGTLHKPDSNLGNTWLQHGAYP